MTTCRSCGAAVLWARTINGKPMPLDAEPAPDGICGLDRGKVVILPEGSAYDGLRYTSHFATCPHADTHRKARR